MPRIPRRTLWPGAVAALLIALALITYSTDALDGDKANVIVAGAALLTAVASWSATARASDTADAMRKIERDRWRREFAPVMTFERIRPPGPAQDKTTLRFKYDGPAMHERVTVRLSIVNDGRFRRPGVTQGLSQQQIDKQIWGPYRFEPGIDGASADGKTVPPHTLSVGDQHRVWVQRTSPPAEYPHDLDDWMDDYLDAPLRLRVEIVAGEETWVGLHDVEQTGPP